MTSNDIDGLLGAWSPCRTRTGIYFVVGTITGDRNGRFLDGTLMTTSMLKTPGEDLVDGMVVETLNSRYRLGSRATEVTLDAFLYAASLDGHVIGLDGKPVEEMAAAGNRKSPRDAALLSLTPELQAAAVRVVSHLAQAWALTEGELAELLGVQPEVVQAWRQDSCETTPAALERISVMLGIFRAINTLIPEPSAADGWIRRPNAAPHFGGRTALATMLQGGLPAIVEVRRYLDAQIWGQ